jgi:preprotein translocase subunit SecE
VAETSKPKRRIVKKAETVREKTEKSALPKPDKKAGVLRLTLRYIGTPFKWLGKKLAKLGRFKPLRILGRILWPTYFRNSWKELRQVTWPTRRETWQLTFAVIIFSIIFGLLIAVVDYGLDKGFKQLIIK